MSSLVLTHVYEYSQKKVWNREAGGQLFSPAPHEDPVRVVTATGPYSQDYRTPYSFRPNRKLAEKDRREQFILGNHVVGVWHTHPESDPTPSFKDKKTTKAYLEASSNVLNGFILAILGNKGNPINLNIWLALFQNSNVSWVKLKEE